MFRDKGEKHTVVTSDCQHSYEMPVEQRMLQYRIFGLSFYIRRDDRFIAGDIESLERERTTSIEYSTCIAPMGIVVPLFCVGMILYSYLCMSNVFLMLQLLRRLLFCIKQLESGTMKARLPRRNIVLACRERSLLHLLLKLVNRDTYSNDNASGICHILLVLQI